MNNFKYLILLGVVVFFLFACARSTDGNRNLEVRLQQGGELYRGGLHKAWVILPDPVNDEREIRWRTGRADIARRVTVRQENTVIGDTVYLYWQELPLSKIVLDTVRGDSDSVIRVDSSRVFLDTIAVVVAGQESEGQVVQILNILPHIDSLWVGGRSQPGDSNLVVAAHPGEWVEIRMSLRDAFNGDFRSQVNWPDIGRMDLVQRSDSLFIWRWLTPNVEMDEQMILEIFDGGGFGVREYRLRVVVYPEPGSAWVAAGSEIVKFARSGAEVARVHGPFLDISDISLNSNSNQMWIADRGRSAIHLFDTFGNRIFRDSLAFRLPLSVAVDVESGYLWVSDLDGAAGDTLRSRVRRFFFVRDSLQVSGAAVPVAGPVRGLSLDQFQRDLTWFVSPESDFVGYFHTGTQQPRIFQDGFNFNRPTDISYDPVAGVAWVADSSRVLVLDTAGNIRASITGFQFAVAVSAAGGVCWVADALAGSIYRFPRTMQGNRTVTDGLRVGGMSTPYSVATFGQDRSVWVADRSAGEVLHVSSEGAILNRGTGLRLPHLVRVHQVLE